MAELYGKARSTINEHILNAYKEKEIEEAKTMRKIGISDFSTKPTNYYINTMDDLDDFIGFIANEDIHDDIAAYKNGLLRAYVMKEHAKNLSGIIKAPTECYVENVSDSGVWVRIDAL